MFRRHRVIPSARWVGIIVMFRTSVFQRVPTATIVSWSSTSRIVQVSKVITRIVASWRTSTGVIASVNRYSELDEDA